jgi:hypothetical protein
VDNKLPSLDDFLIVFINGFYELDDIRCQLLINVLLELGDEDLQE